MAHEFNGSYTGEHTPYIAFPLGGIGAGMMCLDGAGGFCDVALRHQPDLFTKPMLFAAVHVKDHPEATRVLEGPVPMWRLYGPGAERGTRRPGYGRASGLPRFEKAAFTARFPFASVALSHPSVPVSVELTGWSPFIPGDADNSSLPVAAVEYQLANPTGNRVEAVFSFHAANFIASGDGPRGVARVDGGFLLWQRGTGEKPWHEGAVLVAIDEADAAVDCRWFRGGWWDSLTVLWQTIRRGQVEERPPVTDGEPSGGGSIYLPVTLSPGEERTIRIRLSWYVPVSRLRAGGDASDASEGDRAAQTHRPWYVGRFGGVGDVETYWREHAGELRARSALFRDTLYDTTLPPEVMEAISANLTILKSPTVLRQSDGRLWCFEGCGDDWGCCHGSCTHVWNYAQAIPHLFPDLERSLRETEFHECQDERGHQNFRAPLPIRPADHSFHAAADGQLGGIMKVYREWRISGDTEWLRGLWPQVRQSLLYCIDTWDPRRRGVIEEPHHNTYDIEFWGPDGMCSSFYLGALVAAIRLAEALGEDPEPFSSLSSLARERLERDLYDGEYFVQRIEWRGLSVGDPVAASQGSMGGQYSEEARELLQREGPKYQYGSGCLADGVLGAWLADMCGLGGIADAAKVASHVRAVYRHNLRRDLSSHANPQRPEYALGHEGGLLLCTWPKGGSLSLPFVYSDEVWTGIEYQVASHLIRVGARDEGLEVVRLARARYDGQVRNPFDELECGHWYARALSSYALLYALTGARYDATEQVLHLSPRVEGDWRAFLCTATGYGTVGMKGGEPFLQVRAGKIPVQRIEVE